MERSVALLCASALFTCTPATTTSPREATPPPPRTVSFVPEADAPDGFAFGIQEGKPAAGGVVAVPLAMATKLDTAVTDAVLARLGKLDAGTTAEFAFRDRSVPAPRTGETIAEPFPPPAVVAAPQADVAGQLEVVRFAPEGDVPIAPQLSVTFSQPMVPVTSHGELAAADVPVRITPAPTGGTFRWVGTRTVLFEADERLPMATTYRVEIPAGTTSATGGELAAAKSWTFATPAPQIHQKFPTHGPHATDTMIAIAFDQRIDPAAVLATIQVRFGKTRYPVELVSDAVARANDRLKPFFAKELDGRRLVFRTTRPLPTAATVKVVVEPGTPSLEGPRKTDKPQLFTFRTYEPLMIKRHRCGWSHDECRPQWPFNIELNNPLDEEAFDQSWVKIEPPLAAMRAVASYSNLSVQGRSAARTEYRVTLSANLRDKFGQTLGEDQTITYQVGPARPQLSAARQGFVVLDPAAKGTYSLFSVNFDKLKVQVYRVTADEWLEFIDTMRQFGWRGEGGKKKMPGVRVVNKTIRVEANPDEMVETRIDLAPALAKDGKGHAIVVAEHLDPPPPHTRRTVIRSWVQVTDIGLDAFVDDTELVAWATALDNGAPLEGVEVRLRGVTKKTGKDGVASLPLEKVDEPKSGVLVATSGSDVAILPEQVRWWGSGSAWVKQKRTDSLRWYVFDDRHMYRPGETVSLKGWVRRFGAGEDGDLGPLDGTKELSYRVRDPRGEILRRGKVKLNPLSGFDFTFDLPDEANLGWMAVELEAKGTELGATTHVHRLQVQEFRRPEFEVAVTNSQGPHFVGESATATVSASYFAGGGLPNAPVNWQVSTSAGQFVPPNRDAFTFGTWTPWWGGVRYQKGSYENFNGQTDATGKHHIELTFERAKPPRPTSVKAEAAVTDVNRQRWTASSTMLVHPASWYVGLKTDGWFVERGTKIDVDAIVTDLDGEALAGQTIAMEAVHLEWVTKDGSWQEKEERPQSCTVDSSAEPVRCSFETPDGGTYKVRATIHDQHQRPNQSEVTVWVTGGKLPPSRNVEQEAVTLIPNKKEYQPGDTAELMVQAPFFPAEGILSLRKNGIQSEQRFRMESSSTVLKIPITEQHLPAVHAQVDLVGSAARVDDQGNKDERLPARPAFAKGVLKLLVPARSRTLTLTAAPKNKEIEPGGETTVDVTVLDAAGKPVAGSEVAVIVVDEAILALSSYQLGDPITSFYAELGPGGRDHHLRANVLLADPEGLVEMAEAEPPGEPMAQALMSVGGVGGLVGAPMTSRSRRGLSMEKSAAGPRKPEPIRMRADFDALALFSPENPTDAKGRVAVKVKVPDNLTRYRVMAVAAAGARQFGKTESTITARLPIMVRPSPPRFLNFGDRLELPVVIQNQTDNELTVDVVVRASNLDITDGGGRRVEVAPRDRVEVRFPAAANAAGEAVVQIGVVTGSFADAATVRFPVWTPATTEAFATYGEIDDGAIRQPVRAPADVVRQFGGLEVTTSSTALQALTDAVLYLVAYPYECAEQVSSRLIAIAALRDVLATFEAEGLPKKDELAAAMQRDIRKLNGLQNSDGGFGLWRSDGESWPYVTAHATHALWRAKSKGYDVPKETLERAQQYLRNIESHVEGWPSDTSRRTIIAYATHVLDLMGDEHPDKARRIIKEKGLPGLSLEAIGWVLPVLAGDAGQVAAIRKYLNNEVTETAAAANFVTAVHDGDYLTMRSSRRADAVILDALIVTQPKHDLIAKLVRGLLAHRVRGRWGNTQENVFVLLALDRYFARFEKQTPDFVARAWLGEQFAGEQKFKGRSTDRHHIDIPMRLVEGEQDLVLQKMGAGRLYYRIGMRYAPTDLVLEPADHGFTVERSYEHVDDAGDVTRAEDGTWMVKAGARVRVRLRMVAPSRRYHVALVDPLPAGLEPLNPALAVTGDLPADKKGEAERPGRRWWWWWRPWFEHQNMRDERVEAFASLVWDGVHSYTYVTRATTPGSFIVPPTKAEEMYHPETFGRSGTDRLVVE